MEKARNLFKLIYKVGMILVTLTLGGLAVLAYVTATPGNQLLLVSGILAILTLMAGLSITKLDDEDRQAETYRSIIDDVRSLAKGAHPDFKPARPAAEASGDFHSAADDRVSVTAHYSEPEVHRVDTAMLDEAKRMAADGAPIDDICRMIDPEHDRRDIYYQEAFRRLVTTMIEQG